ncbi:MAG: ATP synthase F0 subunit B [Bacteroidetes bacterium RIFCSPHIGHO2_02_FULL_44_7]|nr:MAG: ATP synthase F0 subunit B [Bacteroidetes bacterium RIFCSPHIGHO2_02_FULL_44_7]
MDKLFGEFSIGLFVWQTILFLALLFLLRKFAWKPILNAVNEREQKISDSLVQAELAQKEIASLKAQNEDLLREARAERDAMIKDAKETTARMIDEAKQNAKDEGAKQLEAARVAIKAEKAAAITELKTQVAAFSIEIAEKVVRGELASSDKQKALADKLVEDINMN